MIFPTYEVKSDPKNQLLIPRASNYSNVFLLLFFASKLISAINHNFHF